MQFNVSHKAGGFFQQCEAKGKGFWQSNAMDYFASNPRVMSIFMFMGCF